MEFGVINSPKIIIVSFIYDITIPCFNQIQRLNFYSKPTNLMNIKRSQWTEYMKSS